MANLSLYALSLIWLPRDEIAMEINRVVCGHRSHRQEGSKWGIHSEFLRVEDS